MDKRTIVLGGERVALARMTEEDQISFQQWHAENPELRQFVDNENVPTMEDQMRWFARSREPDRLFFSLVAFPEERLIGHGGFVDIDRDRQTAVLRITIGDSAFWGKGYGTEAVTLLLRYAFIEMRMPQVTLSILCHNDRALHVYEKAGFRLMQEKTRADGKKEAMMQIDKEHFLAMNP